MVHDNQKRKTTQQTRNRRELPQLDKGHLWKPTANIILSDERLNGFPLITGLRLECLLLPDKKHPHWKWKHTHTSDIILSTESPKESTQKLWKLINEFCQIAEHKISILKSTVCLYASNEQSKNKVKEIIPFYLIKKNKILTNKFNQRSTRLIHWKVQYIVTENYKRPK